MFRHFFSSGYSKAIAIIAILAIVIGTPLVILNVKSQQTLQQNASVFGNGGHDTCNKVTINISENPVCPNISSPQKNNVSSYTVAVTITSNDGKPHAVEYTDQSDFCLNGYLSGGCSDNAIKQHLTKTTSFTVVIPRSPTIGLTCGSYQTDFRIASVDNNTNCNYNLNSAGASGQCETGNNCSPTPKPTSTPTPRITLTNTPTPKPTITPSPGVTWTPTPKPTVTPAFTPTPKQTVTPINSPTPTACVTPGIVTNVRITCPQCSGTQ